MGASLFWTATQMLTEASGTTDGCGPGSDYPSHLLLSKCFVLDVSAWTEVRAERNKCELNRNVRILTCKVSIGQCAQAAQASQFLNARVAFKCSILYHTPITKVDKLMRNIERRNSNITTWSCVYFFHRGLPFFARLMGNPHITASRVASMCSAFCAEVAVDTTHI